MNSDFFNAVAKGPIGNGSVKDLRQWISDYIDVLFPDHGIYYWSASSRALAADDPLPHVGGKDTDIHHVVAYVRQGSNEGRAIEVALSMQSGEYRELAWAKSFGSDDECWRMAQAISNALDHIFSYDEVPEIVALAERVPRNQFRRYETAIEGPVFIEQDDHRFRVVTDSGKVLDEREFSIENSKFRVEAYVKDWTTVLRNLKLDCAIRPFPDSTDVNSEEESTPSP